MIIAFLRSRPALTGHGPGKMLKSFEGGQYAEKAVGYHP